MKKLLLIATIALSTVANLSFAQTVDTAKPMRAAFRSKKKLIEFGQGMPNSPVFVKDNQALFVARGMDGIAFRTNINNAENSVSIFYNGTLSIEDVALDTLSQIVWDPKLTDNFLHYRVNDYSLGTLPNFFSDSLWNIYIENAKMISLAVVAARVKGILLDTEPYGATTWKYNTSLYSGETFETVQAKVRLRGKQFSEALQTYKSDIKIFATGLWSFCRYQTNGNIANLSTKGYALLKAFSDGMLEGLHGNAKLIDGDESSYNYHKTLDWVYNGNAYNLVANNGFIAPELQAKSDTFVQVGHMLRYSDTTYNGSTDTTLFLKLEHQIYEGLLWSDEYDIFYSEIDPSFWSDTLPSLAKKAIDSAQYRIDNNLPPRFCVTTTGAIAYSNDPILTSPYQEQVFNIGDTITYSFNNFTGLTYITYEFGYKQIANISRVQKKVALYPGTYQVFVYTNNYTKQSQPVTYYVSDACGNVNRQKPVRGSNQSDNSTQDSDEMIKVYPNPSYDLLNFELFSFAEPKLKIEWIKIFGIDGRLLLTHNNSSHNENNVTLDIHELVPGTYTYRVFLSNDRIENGKIVKLE